MITMTHHKVFWFGLIFLGLFMIIAGDVGYARATYSKYRIDFYDQASGRNVDGATNAKERLGL